MFRGVACLAGLMACLSIDARAAAEPMTTDTSRPLRQVAGILEYISGDYRGAVDERGRVLAETEYQEQVSMAAEADALTQHAGLSRSDALVRQLAELRRALHERRPPLEVARLCRDAREIIVVQHGVILSPQSIPSRSDGARLYVENGCTTCHGADGSAQTEAAAKLQPRPCNFLSAERMAAVSAYRAFHALSSGVPGTAMQSYAQLGDAARWSLAFYVLSLRHQGEDLAAGKRVMKRNSSALPTTAARLFALTDEDILAQLDEVIDPAQRAQVLAYLRAEAPFSAPPAEPDATATSLEPARKALHAGLQAYRRGDRATARQQFVSAYLDGFEPHEAALGVSDRELVREVERSMLSLRQAAAHGAPLERIETLTRESELLLARAEHGRGSAAAGFWGALTITLREGLEIALLITALLTLVRKRGQAQLTAYVHAGWSLAVVAGLLTWFAVGALLSGMHRELAEGIAALLAAVVLLGVTHWMLGQLTAKRFMGFLATRLGAAASRSAAAGVLGLSFLAVYREALEIVLFFQALLLDAGEGRARVWLGAGAGLCALLAVAFVLKHIGQRLRPRPFMLLSSALLAALSFVLAGKGIRGLQEAGVLSLTELDLPELPWLGIWPTLEGLLAQGLVLLLLTGSALWPWLSQGRDTIGDSRKERLSAP